MAETVSECSTNRERLWAELDGRRLRPIRSYANFVLFAAPSGSAADDARALRELGVAVRPFVDVSSLGDALRVTVGPWPMMETFLDALDRLVDDAGDRDAGGTGA